MPSLSPLCQFCYKSPGFVRPHLFPTLSFPICSSCLDGRRYSQNKFRVGLSSALPSFSVEFEIHTSSDAARNRALTLLNYSYVRTDDATVSDEYKSPIYCSLSAFRRHLPILDDLRELVDDCCGTHVHMGFSPHVSLTLVELSDTIFGPLQRHLKTHQNETEQFWGRFFCKYAYSDTRSFYPWVRLLTNYDTIEYRLPRFRTARQYIEVVRFCRRITRYLDLTLSLLEERHDPYGTHEQAWRLGQTPECMGERLLHLYHEAFHNYRRSSRWQSEPVQPALSFVS